MTDKKCIVMYNLIINGNNFHRYKSYERRHIIDPEYNNQDQDKLCCDKMKESFERFLDDSEQELGVNYYMYDDTCFNSIKYCPFCGAKIEYLLNKKQKYVNKPEPKWILVDIPEGDV